MDKMHHMEDAPRMLTIVGLVVEGLALLVFIAATIIANIVSAIPKEDLLESGWLAQDVDIFLQTATVLVTIFMAIAILLGIMFTVNVFVFRRMMKGQFTESQAKYVYLYQAIWGGISLTFNTITGVLYLISALQTHSKRYALTSEVED